MKITFLKAILCCAMLLIAGNTLQAQKIITVYGKVLNQAEGVKEAKPFSVNETVYILAFNTVEAAKDALTQLETVRNTVSPDAMEKAKEDGYYEIRVAENGALLIHVGMKTELVEVNYKEEHNVNIKGAIELEEVVITKPYKRFSPPHPIPRRIIFGGLFIDNSISFPQGYGAANRRLILTPFIIDCQTGDTVKTLDPIVLDGKKYKCKSKNDPYAPYVNRNRYLTKKPFTLSVRDTVVEPLDPQKTYSVLCQAVILKKDKKVHESYHKLTSCKVKRPMQFLELPFEGYELDPNKYQEHPRPERRTITDTISLTFLPNKAELDPNDPNNALQINQLQDDLREEHLKEFKITGISSPEGSYQSGMSLAKRRTDYAMKQITSMIPPAKWARVYHPVETRTATWDEVADLLEKDTLLDEAAEVREIIGKFESQDAQYAAIRKLPYYETAIKNILPKLRTVKYEYVYEVFRALTPDEIANRYYNDPAYKDGKKQFSRYEYWHLFQQIKDPKEAEKLFRRAYKETMAYDEKGNPTPWVLAANNLAVALLKRDTFDVEVLKPLIDYRRPVNSSLRYDDGFETIITEVNPEDVVANQLAMCIRANDLENVSFLAYMLPDTDKFKMIKAFSDCIEGYYNYRMAPTEEEREQRKEIFELVKNSSPINHVVMCMAIGTDSHNEEALRILETIPPTTQTKYMKLQLFVRMNHLTNTGLFQPEKAILNNACKMLDEIIKEAPNYLKIAENDGELSEEFMEYFANPSNWKDK